MEDHPAYKYSIKILSKRDYSIHKMRSKLIQKGFEDVAEDIISLLVQRRFIREDLYIEAKIKALMQKNFSPSYIIAKLTEEKLHVDHSKVQSVFDDWGYTEDSQIENLIRKKSILHNWNEQDIQSSQNKAKLSRFIQSKGHNWENIKELF